MFWLGWIIDKNGGGNKLLVCFGVLRGGGCNFTNRQIFAINVDDENLICNRRHGLLLVTIIASRHVCWIIAEVDWIAIVQYSESCWSDQFFSFILQIHWDCAFILIRLKASPSKGFVDSAGLTRRAIALPLIYLNTTLRFLTDDKYRNFQENCWAWNWA